MASLTGTRIRMVHTATTIKRATLAALMPTATQHTTTHSASSLIALMWLASPALPVGGFSYSEGLEAAIDAGYVHNEASTTQWVCDQLHLTLARADLVILRDTLQAWHAQDTQALLDLDQWIRQTRESAELRLQTEQMGRSLVEWLKTTHPTAAQSIAVAWPQSAPTYPVAFGIALATLLGPSAAQDPTPALTAYAFSWAENMVQAALKAVPLGQSAGQRMLQQLGLAIPPAIAQALGTPSHAKQSFSPMLAILSARHETQYSRLFRS
jgi:urease accessory protein